MNQNHSNNNNAVYGQPNQPNQQHTSQPVRAMPVMPVFGQPQQLQQPVALPNQVAKIPQVSTIDVLCNDCDRAPIDNIIWQCTSPCGNMWVCSVCAMLKHRDHVIIQLDSNTRKKQADNYQQNTVQLRKLVNQIKLAIQQFDQATNVATLKLSSLPQVKRAKDVAAKMEGVAASFVETLQEGVTNQRLEKLVTVQINMQQTKPTLKRSQSVNRN